MSTDFSDQSKVFWKRLPNIATLVMAILVVREVAPLVLEADPVQAAITHMQTWRESLDDPRTGSAVSLSMLTPIGPHKASARAIRSRRVLLLLVNGCGT